MTKKTNHRSFENATDATARAPLEGIVKTYVDKIGALKATLKPANHGFSEVDASLKILKVWARAPSTSRTPRAARLRHEQPRAQSRAHARALIGSAHSHAQPRGEPPSLPPFPSAQSIAKATAKAEKDGDIGAAFHARTKKASATAVQKINELKQTAPVDVGASDSEDLEA